MFAGFLFHCKSINLFFQDESRFGLLTVLRRMITAKGVKPVALSCIVLIICIYPGPSLP